MHHHQKLQAAQLLAYIYNHLAKLHMVAEAIAIHIWCSCMHMVQHGILCTRAYVTYQTRMVHTVCIKNIMIRYIPIGYRTITTKRKLYTHASTFPYISL